MAKRVDDATYESRVAIKASREFAELGRSLTSCVGARGSARFGMPTREAVFFFVEPRFRIRCVGGPVFGPGKAELLERVEKTGSITKAAKAMEMSYMRAWVLVKSLECGFAEPLVRKLRGGHTRGGAELTDTGREVLRLYRELEGRAAEAAKKMKPQFASLLRREST